MFKQQSFNQTQFSSEDPLLHGRIALPPEELDPEELALQKQLRQSKQQKLMSVLGFSLLMIGFVIWVASSWRPSPPTRSVAQEEEVVIPTPGEMSLREEIDQLMRQVDSNKRIGQTLAFPPVASDLTVEAP